MNKKKIIISLSILLILIIILFIFIYFTSPEKPLENNTEPEVIPVSENLDNEIYKPKPIELELMTDQDKEILNISAEAYRRIQVLEKEEDGGVITYRIINSDADILTEY